MEKAKTKSKCVYKKKISLVQSMPIVQKRIAGYLTNRAAALDAKEVQLFMESDPATQKLLNLIAILKLTGCF